VIAVLDAAAAFGVLAALTTPVIPMQCAGAKRVDPAKDIDAHRAAEPVSAACGCTCWTGSDGEELCPANTGTKLEADTMERSHISWDPLVTTDAVGLNGNASSES